MGKTHSVDSATRITITKEQSLKLQKLLREKPAGMRKFTDQEIRKNASRLKIPAVKIRYWLKQRNALHEGPKPPATSVDDLDSRCKLFKELPFDKKVILLRKTRSVTTLSIRQTQDLSQELKIPESKIYNWLKHKVFRNLHSKESLMPQEIAALNKKFSEFDFLDDDSALLLADKYNVSTSVIKKAFQRRKPVASPNIKPVPLPSMKPVIEVKKLQLPASVTVTPITPATPQISVPKVVLGKLNPEEGPSRGHFKTVDQKNTLFEVFRLSPTVTKPDTLAELVKTTRLTATQIVKWLSAFRMKWAQSNESGLKKALTRDLNHDQLVLLEKAYREERFLTNAQLIELPKVVGIALRAVQAWFSNRRVYEIRSSNKDLVSIGLRTVAAKKEAPPVMLKPTISIPQTIPPPPISEPAAEDDGTEEFFESLSKEQKMHLKAACNNYNSQYKRLARTLNLPIEKIRQYIRSYRVRHSVFRKGKKMLPERVHKALLSHYLKHGKISSKTSVMLAKRLKIRPEQVVGWNNDYANRILAAGGVESSATVVPAIKPKPVVVEPVVEEPKLEPADTYEQAEEPVSSETQQRASKSIAKRRCLPRSKRRPVAAAAKAILFEEFLKSPQGAYAKCKQLSNAAKLTPVQVRKWFYNFGKTLGEQAKSKVVACLNNPEIGSEARTRLEKEYRERRFLEESKIDTLASECGLHRRYVVNWFINARYYEALVGERPGEIRAPVRIQVLSKSAPSSKTFYQALDSDKQARLNEELDSYPFDDEKLEDLANELDVPSKDLKKWFDSSSRSTRSRRRSLPESNPPPEWLNLTIKQMETLVTEFEADPNLSDERAATMAKRIKLAKDRIKAWFENRRQELRIEDKAQATKHKISPIKIIMPKYANSNEMPTIAPAADTSPTDSSKKYETKVPVQQNRLFEEFKRSSSLTSERLAKISADTNLSGKQISAWFNWLNYKLQTIPRETLSEENRNKYLTMQQVEELERYYAESRYVNKASRESLSVELDVSKNLIKSWFASRRYYEILFKNGSIDAADANYEDQNGAEIESGADEPVIDYDWDDGNSTAIEDVDPFEQKFYFGRPLEVDPLSDVGYVAAPAEDVDEDLTSLPHKPRDRLVTPLDDDLEPLEEDVEKLFWFANKKPNSINEKYDKDIDEERNSVLETEFGKYPWPDLDRISQLSAQLLVSEPKIYWWFIKQRCFLTKTISTSRASHSKSKPTERPKNVLIDLTNDDAIDNESPSTKCGEFEFVTLDETAKIKEEEEPMHEDNDIENGDPFENNAIDEQSPTQSDNEEEETFQESNESIENIGISTTSANSSTVKNEKKKTPLTSHQRAILIQEYKRNKFITNSQARMLAQDLGLGVTRVETWFESMRKSAAAKKANPVETSISVKNLTPELESSLEAEYVKNSNLTAKRVKMIALKLKIKKKTVEKWFTERTKRKEKDDQIS